MSDNLTELLRKYSTEPEDMEKLLKELHAGMEQRKIEKPEVAVLNTPQIFDWEEARGMGIPVRQGWMLKLTPDTSERGYKLSFLTPEKWEITEDWEYISPEGKQYDYTEMETVVGEHPEAVYGELPPEEDLLGIVSYLESNPEEFMADLMEAGRTTQSEELLRKLGASEAYIDYLFMGEEERASYLADIYMQGRTAETEATLTDLGVENIEEFFEKPSTIEAAKAAYGEAEWIQKPSLEIYEDQPWYMKYTPLALFLAPGIISPKAQAGLGIGIAYFEKYVQMPWESAALAQQLGLQVIINRDVWDDYNKETLLAMGEVYEKYGTFGAYFSDEMHEIVEGYKRHESVKEQFLRGQLPMEIGEWLNPVYLIPIGGTASWGARLLSKVPVIGKVARYTAAGVQATERGLMYPVTKPIELGAKGLQQAGVKLGEKYANKLISQSAHLTDMAVPASREIEEELFASNWMKAITKTLSRAPVIGPGVKWGVMKTLGPRELINLESRAVEDVVGRQAIIWLEVRRRGMAAASAKIWELRSISLNPTRLFGFDENAISKTIPRLSEKASGTLEDIFTHPELYRLTENQLAYVTRLHELNTEVLNFLKNEGVAPRVVSEDWWVHRVVVGKFDKEGELILVRGRPGMRGTALGSKRAYEMHREAPTMAEGIKWGIKYSKNPEDYISTYIQEAYNKVADARFAAEVAEFGTKPIDVLRERYPEVLERAELTAQELVDARKFEAVVGRASRGERIPEQTLRAMERRFPELGRRLRGLVEEKITGEAELRKYLTELGNQNKELKRLLAEKKTVQAASKVEVVRAIPDEQKLTEAFRVMDYEDRVAFRSTMEEQTAELQVMLGEQSRELGGIREFLESDPIAVYRGFVGKKKVPLTSLLVRGRWPETVTRKQAFMLRMGKEPSPSSLTKEGRVKWEYIVDELSEHFHISEQEFINRLEKLASYKQQEADLLILIRNAEGRQTDIKAMLDILNKVDVKYEAGFKPIPKAEAGMPEAGLQKDIFGYEHPVFPKGKGELTQISMDDYAKLSKAWKEAGLPGEPANVGVKPQIEGIEGFTKEAQAFKTEFAIPEARTAAQRTAELKALRKEAQLLVEQRKWPYWKARTERTARMEQIRQPGIEEGYIMQPMFGGKLYGRDFIDVVNQWFGHNKGAGFLKFTSDLAGILRITKAALDFSFMALQGLPSWGLAHAFLLVNPRIGVRLCGQWYKALGFNIGTFFRPEILADVMKKEMPHAMERIAYGGSSAAVDWFEAMAAEKGLGGLGAKVLGSRPMRVIGLGISPFQRAEFAFYGSGEMVRNSFWEILRPLATKKGEEFQLAKFLDIGTGILDTKAMGVPLTIRQLESSFIWFAPRYTRACLSVLAHLFRGGMTGSMARKAIGGMIGAGALYYSAVQYGISTLQGKSHDEAMDDVVAGFGVVKDPITGEITWQPSGRFMTVRIGDSYFGLGSFWYGLVRLSGNILQCINEEGDKELIDLVKIIKYGSLNRDNPFVYWWYSRSSALTGTIRELVTHRTFLGYPIETPVEFAWYVANRFTPIWMEQAIIPYFAENLKSLMPNLAEQYEIPEGEARILTPFAEVLGLRTWPGGEWTRFYDKSTEVIGHLPVDLLQEYYTPEEMENVLKAQAEGTLTWKQLPKTLRMKLLQLYPELNELYEEGIAASMIRDSDAWQSYTARLEEERNVRNERIDSATERFLSGEIDAREWDKLCDDAESNYAKGYEDISTNPAYAEIFDYFRKKETKGDKYGWQDDIALAEYQDIIYADDLYDERSQTYDWDERDRRITEFIDKWGMDVYERILWYQREKKKDTGLNDIRVLHSKDLEILGREYWELPYKEIYQMDEEDKLEGSIPGEYLSQWEGYQKAEDKDAFLEEHPELTKDFRAEWRVGHPQEDAMLKLWGYGGDLQTKEAYDILVKRVKELGFNDEALVKMKLPPVILVDSFFGYKDIQREFSGNSAEARLFRLEHGVFNDWGMEAYGWKEVEDNINALRLQVQLGKMDEGDPQYAITERKIQAYDYGVPDEFIDLYVQYYNFESKGYDQERFLRDNKDYYNKVWLGVLGNKPIDFSKVPTVKEENLLNFYDNIPSGSLRLEARCKNKDLDNALVKYRGLKPAYGTDRCS